MFLNENLFDLEINFLSQSLIASVGSRYIGFGIKKHIHIAASGVVMSIRITE